MKRLLLILSICLCFNCFTAYSKDGDEHRRDMIDIFPFSKNCNKICGESNSGLYVKVNRYLDVPDYSRKGANKPAFVSNDPLFNSLTFKGHRIWYHWGFNDYRAAKSYDELAKDCIQFFLDKGQITADDAERFWRKLEIEEVDRTKKLLEDTAKALGYIGYANSYPLQKKQIEAFATLLYSIHLMGDHTTSYYWQCRSQKQVREDIYHAIKELGGYQNRKSANRLINYLEIAAPLSENSDIKAQQNAAQLFLDAMKNKRHGFSQFILNCSGAGYRYQNRFKEAGLQLKQSNEK